MNRPAKHIVAIGSGKGGVGKSTVALNVALALRQLGQQVGLLDADLFGPNIPRMLNLRRAESASSWDLARNPRVGRVRIEPLECHGLQVMSSAFVIGEDHPLTFAAPLVHLVLRQFFYDVAWRDLDYLIVDLPPGTADLHQTLTQSLPLDGAVVVVTPEDVSHLDGRKAVEMFRRSNVAILGGVENMAAATCPHCGEGVEWLPATPEDRTIWSRDVQRLGSVCFDPTVARAGQSGHPIVLSSPDSQSARELRCVAERIVAESR